MLKLECYVESVKSEPLDKVLEMPKDPVSYVVIDRSRYVVSGEHGAIVFSFNTAMIDGKMVKDFYTTAYHLHSTGRYDEAREEKCKYLNRKSGYSIRSDDVAKMIVEDLTSKNQFDEEHIFEELICTYGALFLDRY